MVWGVILVLEQIACKNMYKVVLVLRQIAIRLKECELDVVLRKNKESVVLCSKAHLTNGTCIMNAVKEFYVEADDCLVTLVLYIFLGNDKRYGGEVSVNVFQWQENVIQATQSKINNSPDKNSRIKYEFYYFRDDKVVDNRPFFMSGERHKGQYNLIESSNKVLVQEKMKLEQELLKQNKKNEFLETNRQDLVDNMNLREITHQNEKGNYIECINQYSQEFVKEKQKREGLMKLAEMHGIDRPDWQKHQ